MANKKITLKDPLTGDMLFPATTTESLYGPDGKPFDFDAVKPAIIDRRKLAPNHIIFTGDVVDVLDDGTIGKTSTVPQYSNNADGGAITGDYLFTCIRPKCCMIDDNRAILIYSSRTSATPKILARIYNITDMGMDALEDSSGAKEITLLTESSAAYINGMTITLLSDNRFLLVYNTNYNKLKATVVRVSGTSLSVPTPTILCDGGGSMQQGPNGIDTLLIDSDTVIVFYHDTSNNKLSARIVTISNIVTVSSGDPYTLENNHSPYHVTATRLPDGSGSIRICVVYTQTSSGGTFAVVVTIADGVISWGTPVAVDAVEHAHDSICAIDNRVYVIMHTSKTIKKIIVQGTNIVVSDVTAEIPIDSTCGTTKMISKNGRIIVTYTIPGQTQYIYTSTLVIDDIGDGFIVGTPYQRTLSSSNIYWNHTVDMVIVDKNKFFVCAAYGFSSTDKRYLAYMVNVLQNQCADRIIDTSRHAIALQDGSAYAGDSIDVIFDGTVKLPGIARGYEIKSNLGVYGYCPTNDILSVIPAWNSDITDRIIHVQWSGSQPGGVILDIDCNIIFAVVHIKTSNNEHGAGILCARDGAGPTGSNRFSYVYGQLNMDQYTPLRLARMHVDYLNRIDISTERAITNLDIYIYTGGY